MARAGGLVVYLRTMAVFALAWYGLSLLVGSRLLLPSPMLVADGAVAVSTRRRVCSGTRA